MEKIIVSRTDGEVMVTLLPHKDGSGWSFVNLTKGHICPCKFDSKKAGLQDLDSKPNVISYQMIEQKNQTKAERIRAMGDEELAKHLHDIGWDCHLCAEHRRLDNEPLLRGEKCDEKCVEHCLEWLKQPAE